MSVVVDVVVVVVDDAFVTVQTGLLMVLRLKFSCAQAAVREKMAVSCAVRPSVLVG